MYSYIKGIVVGYDGNYIILDNNNIGYSIFVSNPYSFKLNEECKVFLYNHIKEDENSLYGFKTLEEKNLFLKLINVKGLGPKMALPILATGSISGIIDAINRENILYLKKFPKIGDKVAKQIVLDLKGKLESSEEIAIDESDDDVVLALVALGYKNVEIKKILPKLNKEDSVEDKIKEALKLLLK